MADNVPRLPDVACVVPKGHDLARDCKSNRSARRQCAVGRASPEAAGVAGKPVLSAVNTIKRKYCWN